MGWDGPKRLGGAGSAGFALLMKGGKGMGIGASVTSAVRSGAQTLGMREWKALAEMREREGSDRNDGREGSAGDEGVRRAGWPRASVAPSTCCHANLTLR